MRPPVFIGDEVTAAGFRLAGARVMTPRRGTEGQTLLQAREGADLVLVTAEVAERIPHELLQQALRAVSPVVLLIPDVRGRLMPPDPAAGLRRQLGLSE